MIWFQRESYLESKLMATKISLVRSLRQSPLSKRQTLMESGVACSTYYRGQHRVRQKGRIGLVDRRPDPGLIWNRLRPEEEERNLSETLRQPDLSPRELACYLSDHAGFTVSESTVYRLLKRHNLIRAVNPTSFPAGKEYRVKTTRVNSDPKP